MQISREAISRRYAALSDGELLAIVPEELSDMALQCYDQEVACRPLLETTDPDDSSAETESRSEATPDWLDSAATVCWFGVGSGERYAENAEYVCSLLRDAGIPSQVVAEHLDNGMPDTLNVMVPGALGLKATSVLDCDYFNAELEEEWSNHFDGLSDGELRAFTSHDLCAGLLDRAARLKRVYDGALARRSQLGHTL